MSYAKYPKEMKEAVVSRIMSGEETIIDIGRDTGININTLWRWRDAAQKKGLSATTKYKNADKWSRQNTEYLSTMWVQDGAAMNYDEIKEYVKWFRFVMYVIIILPILNRRYCTIFRIRLYIIILSKKELALNSVPVLFLHKYALIYLSKNKQ